MKIATTTPAVSRFLNSFFNQTETAPAPLPETMPGEPIDKCPVCGEPLEPDEIADGMCWTCLIPLFPDRDTDVDK